MPLPLAHFKYGTELRAPGDEYNKSPCGEGSPRLLKDKSQLPTLHGELLCSSPGAPSSEPTLEKSDSLGTKSRRKRLWDYLGGRRSKFNAECHSVDLLLTELQIAIRSRLLF